MRASVLSGSNSHAAAPARLPARVSRCALRVRAVAAVQKPSTSAAVVTPETAKDLYSDMLLGREFEEMCAQVGT